MLREGTQKKRIAVLVSGGGTNLQAILDAEKSGIISSGEVVLVISNQKKAYALQRAEDHGIDHYFVSKKKLGSQEAFEEKIADLVTEHHIDMIVLAGFLAILSETFTKKFDHRIINIHPSLIPSFCGEGYYGLKVHEEVLKRGVKITGATVHYVNEIADGGEIIAQKAVKTEENDTPEILQKRVMQQAEWIILPEAVETVCRRIIEEEQKEKRIMDIYDIKDFDELLYGNTYPGRGILIGKTPDGTKAVTAYFIMGRSENSRNRIFTVKNGEVFTEPFDTSKVQDPSLIIYAAVRQFENQLIVTNGDQTDTIYDFLKAGKTFEEALNTREFEPDHPNYTPRISGILTFADGDFTYKMNILKSMDANGSACERFTFSYPSYSGLAHFLHTYVCDGNPIPAFKGEPEQVIVKDDINEFTSLIWNTLDENNKISLYVRYTDLKTGRTEECLVNKNN